MKYYLSICAIAKEEARYLDEWIAYHLIKGVEHFYLRYDHASTDIKAARNVLKKWIDKGIVEVEWTDTKHIQYHWYKEITQNKIINESQWVAFIDIDEFIWSKNNFVDILKSNESVDVAMLHWIHFGDNGHKSYKKYLVVSRFPLHENLNRHADLMTKCVLNLNETVKSLLPNLETINGHDISPFLAMTRMAGNLESVKSNSLYSIILDGNTYDVRLSIKDITSEFALCHFYCKSKEEFLIKNSRGFADENTKRILRMSANIENGSDDDIDAERKINNSQNRYNACNKSESNFRSLSSFSSQIKDCINSYL